MQRCMCKHGYGSNGSCFLERSEVTNRSICLICNSGDSFLGKSIESNISVQKAISYERGNFTRKLCFLTLLDTAIYYLFVSLFYVWVSRSTGDWGGEKSWNHAFFWPFLFYAGKGPAQPRYQYCQVYVGPSFRKNMVPFSSVSPVSRGMKFETGLHFFWSVFSDTLTRGRMNS